MIINTKDEAERRRLLGYLEGLTVPNSTNNWLYDPNFRYGYDWGRQVSGLGLFDSINQQRCDEIKKELYMGPQDPLNNLTSFGTHGA